MTAIPLHVLELGHEAPPSSSLLCGLSPAACFNLVVPTVFSPCVIYGSDRNTVSFVSAKCCWLKYVAFVVFILCLHVLILINVLPNDSLKPAGVVLPVSIAHCCRPAVCTERRTRKHTGWNCWRIASVKMQFSLPRSKEVTSLVWSLFIIFVYPRLCEQDYLKFVDGFHERTFLLQTDLFALRTRNNFGWPQKLKVLNPFGFFSSLKL